LALWFSAVVTNQARAQAQENPQAAVTPPSLVKRVEPIFPVEAVAAARSAEVILTVTINATGAVTDVGVLTSGGGEFDQAAVAAVKQWIFNPATQEGLAVASRIRVPITFVATPPPVPQHENPPSVPTIPGPPKTQPPASPPISSSVATAPSDDFLDATVVGKQRVRSRGTADFDIELGALAVVPRANATEMLKLAPGILLTNEGGEAHAEQIFLRGFDAREGQDIEIAVGGVPVNESGNLHGNGYADLHFVIPEVVAALRVVEGPFDPAQGNNAVAGSVAYDLGLAQRGLTAKIGCGSFDTRRLVLTYGAPTDSAANFAAGELFQTIGFGANRDSMRGSAIAQMEGRLASWRYRFLLQGYSVRYHSAGVVREDDYRSGRMEFFDTYDFNQGGNASRFSIALEIASQQGAFSQRHLAFLIRRSMGLRENFTGFLADPQEPLQPLHSQRGDLLDISIHESTFGARGSGRVKATLLQQPQEIEVGYFIRGDVTSGLQQRIEAATLVPFRTDLDVDSNLGDLGLFIDTSLKPLRWITARGGLRVDLFTFDVMDNCAAKSVAHPSKSDPPGDRSCLDQQDYGRHRESNQRVQTSASAWMPRAALLLGPWWNVTLSSSWGRGMRSIDPQFVTNDIETPFATAESWELGIAWAQRLRALGLSARTAVFRTHVDRDLIFSETTGRNMLGGGTTRIGWLLSTRAAGGFFDSSLNVTLVRSSFDDTGLLIPYVPDLVVRSETAIFGTLWRPFARALSSRAGLGVTYVGRRALPLGQRSDAVFSLDASASLTFWHFTFDLAAQNLLDSQYRLGEYNYASDFHSSRWPTLVPARHFTAGAPRSLMLSLSVNLGGES
jgi:iron complex outermembrane receptor protein